MVQEFLRQYEHRVLVEMLSPQSYRIGMVSIVRPTNSLQCHPCIASSSRLDSQAQIIVVVSAKITDGARQQTKCGTQHAPSKQKKKRRTPSAPISHTIASGSFSSTLDSGGTPSSGTRQSARPTRDTDNSNQRTYAYLSTTKLMDSKMRHSTYDHRRLLAVRCPRDVAR
jgi:hypothetical protein